MILKEKKIKTIHFSDLEEGRKQGNAREGAIPIHFVIGRPTCLRGPWFKSASLRQESTDKAATYRVNKQNRVVLMH